MTQRPALGRTFLTCALLSAAFTVSALSQSTKWKEYVSEKGKFSVLLPGDPTTDYMEGYACWRISGAAFIMRLPAGRMRAIFRWRRSKIIWEDANA